MIAYAGDRGITREEMFDLDERTSRTNLRPHFNAAYIDPSMIIQKDGRYHFHPEFKRANQKFIPDWAGIIKSLAGEQILPPK